MIAPDYELIIKRNLALTSYIKRVVVMEHMVLRFLIWNNNAWQIEDYPRGGYYWMFEQGGFIK